MYPSQQRLTHISASLWQHLYQAQGELEKYGAGDLTATLPTLFAMYYYGVETIMQIPQEEAMPLQTEFQDNVRDLAADGLISEDQATSMLAAAWSAAEEITKVYLAELDAPQPNPIRAIVKGASGVLGLDFGEINQLLATSLTDFVVMSAVGRHTNQK